MQALSHGAENHELQVCHCTRSVQGAAVYHRRSSRPDCRSGSVSEKLCVPCACRADTRKNGGEETQNSGPATHERDWTAPEQPDATHRRINQAGDSVPSSQDSVTRAVQSLRISDSAAAPAPLPVPPPPTMRNARRPPKPEQMPRNYLRCAHSALRDGGCGEIECEEPSLSVVLVGTDSIPAISSAQCADCFHAGLFCFRNTLCLCFQYQVPSSYWLPLPTVSDDSLSKSSTYLLPSSHRRQEGWEDG